ncbi:MAG: gliding motility-associated C-terminal domain-containing protein, partial [Flavobacteriaceae bacterium]
SCSNATVVLDEVRTDGDCPSNYILTRTWTATDECGNSTSHTQTVTVQDTTAPTFNETLPSDETVECDSVADAVTLTASDSCGTADVTFTETTADGDCPSNYIITRTWTATDECGNTTSHTQIVTVEDTTAPVTTTDFETEISVTCGNIPEVPELEFEDACSTNINVDFEETSTNNGNNDSYEITRIWTVSDECDNTEVYSQIIFVTVENVIGGTADLCIEEDFDFDLFSLLSGDFDYEGTWTVTSNNATINGSYFNPSSLLDADGHYTFEQLNDTYTFMYTSTGYCPTETEVTITLNDECRALPCGDADSVTISKAVTANGDQWNEYFEVTGIEGCGFTVEVQIFNRWGAMIYESKDYQNNWNGFVHGSSIGGSEKVPTGTYYYIITLKESGLKPFAGPIYVGTK